MNRYILLLSMLLSCMVFACSNSGAETESEAAVLDEEIQAPEPVLSLQFEDMFDLEMDGKLVEVEGFVALPSFAMFVSNGKGKLDLCRLPVRQLGPDVDLVIEVGDCNNCLAALPNNYSPEDLRLKAEDGTVILANQNAKVFGRLSVKRPEEPGDLEVSLEVQKVTKALDPDPLKEREAAIAMGENDLMDSTLAYKMVKVSGLISMPSMVFMSDEISLTMRVGDEYLSTTFVVGDGPNQMEQLPENFSPKDLNIHGHDGKLLNLKKPVLVYGYRSMPSKDFAGSVKVQWVEQGQGKP